MNRKNRFTTLGCIHLIDLFVEGLEHPTKRNKALPGYLQFLWVCATMPQDLENDVVRELHGVSLATVFRTVRRVSYEISRRQRYIRFPFAQDDVLKKQREFFCSQQFP